MRRLLFNYVGSDKLLAEFWRLAGDFNGACKSDTDTTDTEGLR